MGTYFKKLHGTRRNRLTSKKKRSGEFLFKSLKGSKPSMTLRYSTETLSQQMSF